MSIRRPPKWPLDHEPDAVFDARDRSGMTQRELADLCGVSRSLIAEVELGTRNARPGLIAKLAAALGCRVEDLERKREPEAATAADVDLHEQGLRSGERADPQRVLEVRH